MDQKELSAHIADPARLAALRDVALLDTPTEEAFDRLTWLATRYTKAPVALVSLIDDDRQFFKSCVGLPEPWLSLRETPLSHSFCQYNRIVGQPLLIEDARTDPVFKDNLAIRDLNVIAYLGIPLVTYDGYVLGSFCVIDSKPRKWVEEDKAVVQKLAEGVMTEIHLRTEVAAREKAEVLLKMQNEELLEMQRDLKEETAQRVRALEELGRQEQLLIRQGRLAAMGEMISNIAHQWRQPLNTLALLVQELPIYHDRNLLTGEYLAASVARAMLVINYMSQTIDGFRNFFVPDKDKQTFLAAEVLEKTVALLDAAFAELKLKLEVHADREATIYGCPNEYSQVMPNILMNAKDALLERKVPDPRVEVRLFREGDRSVLTITDNAGGIPEDIMDKIFDPYFTTKGPEQGTGIGLYMSKTAIEKNMGGSLSVSNVDGGARFRISVCRHCLLDGIEKPS